MEKQTQLYEGKAKKVFATDDPRRVIVSYKDDATAFNGEKKGTIAGKGAINNVMSNHLFRLLEQQGVRTHFIEQLSDRETVVEKVAIVPLEVIVRNVAAGSYKNDALGDPLINTYHALALGLATQAELEAIKRTAFRVNEVLCAYFDTLNARLVDFKLEFGRTADGTIVLADEISPDTCRLWDKTTGEKLDKDRFRRNMGGVEQAYQEILSRVMGQ